MIHEFCKNYRMRLAKRHRADANYAVPDQGLEYADDDEQFVEVAPDVGQPDGGSVGVVAGGPVFRAVGVEEREIIDKQSRRIAELETEVCMLKQSLSYEKDQLKSLRDSMRKQAVEGLEFLAELEKKDQSKRLD